MNRLSTLVLLLSLAACRQPEPPVADPPAPSVKSHAAGVAAAQVISPSEAAASLLALDAEGLRLFNAVSGASRLIAFGATKADAMRAIGAAQKLPLSSAGTDVECNATYATWGNGLTAWFADERFIGWSATAGAAPPATAGGARVGSSRKELESVYAIEIKKSTRGVQFNAGALTGLLESDRPEASVTAMWAGRVCVPPVAASRAPPAAT